MTTVPQKKKRKRRLNTLNGVKGLILGKCYLLTYLPNDPDLIWKMQKLHDNRLFAMALGLENLMNRYIHSLCQIIYAQIDEMVFDNRHRMELFSYLS